MGDAAAGGDQLHPRPLRPALGAEALEQVERRLEVLARVGAAAGAAEALAQHQLGAGPFERHRHTRASRERGGAVSVEIGLVGEQQTAAGGDRLGPCAARLHGGRFEAGERRRRVVAATVADERLDQVRRVQRHRRLAERKAAVDRVGPFQRGQRRVGVAGGQLGEAECGERVERRRGARRLVAQLDPLPPVLARLLDPPEGPPRRGSS